MSIRETQYRLAREEILKEELRKGQFPSVSLIESLIEEKFGSTITGLPRFHLRPIEKGKTSDSSSYNAMLLEVSEDLKVGFEQVRQLNNQIIALSQYYESNRARVEQELKTIEMKADMLSDKASSYANRDIVGDSLSDFSQIEFKKDEHRNIPRTDAFIDLRHSEASLNLVSKGSVKHDLSGARTSFRSETQQQSIIHLSPVKNALRDNANDSWRSLVVSDRADGVVCYLDIELDDPIEASQISIDAQGSKPVTATLLLSLDGESYEEHETRKILSNHQWFFERRSIRFIRFKLEKKEEDRANGVEYEYLFGAKRIEAKDDAYLLSNTFVSKPFDLKNHSALGYIHLETEDFVPPGTRIRYYVGLDYGTNIIEWQEIQKNRPIETRMVQEHRLSINPLEIDQFTEGYGEAVARNYGQSFYRIARLDQAPLPKSVQIQMGRNMWIKETILAPPYEPIFDEDGNLLNEALYIPGVKDWARAGTPMKRYMNIDNYQDVLDKDTFQRYSTYVYIRPDSENTDIEGQINVSEEASYTVYLNHNQIKNIHGTYPFNFKPGWNRIDVYTYARKEKQEIILNVYLREVSDQIYAHQEPLREVSLYDLFHNTSNRIHNRFAIDEDNSIIVNYDPKMLDLFQNGVEYTLAYRYSVSDKTEHKLRFMAILSKESAEVSVSPRLKEYKLIIE